MSTQTNEIILERLQEYIEGLDSSVEELAMIKPEFLKMTETDKMNVMQEYIDYLEYKQNEGDAYSDKKAEA